MPPRSETGKKLVDENPIIINPTIYLIRPTGQKIFVVQVFAGKCRCSAGHLQVIVQVFCRSSTGGPAGVLQVAAGRIGERSGIRSS